MNNRKQLLLSIILFPYFSFANEHSVGVEVGHIEKFYFYSGITRPNMYINSNIYYSYKFGGNIPLKASVFIGGNYFYFVQENTSFYEYERSSFKEFSVRAMLGFAAFQSGRSSLWLNAGPQIEWVLFSSRKTSPVDPNINFSNRRGSNIPVGYGVGVLLSYEVGLGTSMFSNDHPYALQFSLYSSFNRFYSEEYGDFKHIRLMPTLGFKWNFN